MIDVLGALMGIDLQASTRPEGSDEVPEGFQRQTPPASQPSSKPSQPTPPPPPRAQEQEDVEMEDADDEELKAKKEAETAKAAGSAAYKKRDFPEAIKNFQLAWDTWPKDLTFLTNLGGMLYLSEVI